MPSFATARRNMVDCQLRTFEVTDRALLAAMNELPRELFVPQGREDLAYLDQNLSFGGEPSDPRVMLAPMILARLIQALAIEPGARALDVAGARGYSAALLARLGARVTALEPRADLASSARSVSPGGAAGGGLAAGVPDGAPFDAILVNGAVEDEPSGLLGQLAEGGRLACLEHREGAGRAVLFLRSGDSFGRRSLFGASAPVLAAFRRSPAFVF